MNTFDLGKPIGQQTTNPREGIETGEHGAGIGVSGGHGVANPSNTQHAQFAEGERSGFNSGLGGEHASGGLPGHSSHPIADKYTTGNTGSSGDKLENSLDHYSKGDSQSHSSSGLGAGAGAVGAGAAGIGAGAGLASHGSAPKGDAVSGAYAGSGTNDALTGESHAQRTGAGVGPLGENATAGSTGGAAALGSGGIVGPSGGAGGHYDPSAPHGHHSGSTGGALAAGAGAAGLGAGAAGAHAHDSTKSTTDTAGAGASGATGHFGTAEKGFDRGAPVSDPSHLDSGGRHGLVFQESTGKYVHRHELEESK